MTNFALDLANKILLVKSENVHISLADQCFHQTHRTYTDITGNYQVNLLVLAVQHLCVAPRLIV
jgi:hypothetical protein